MVVPLVEGVEADGAVVVVVVGAAEEPVEEDEDEDDPEEELGVVAGEVVDGVVADDEAAVCLAAAAEWVVVSTATRTPRPMAAAAADAPITAVPRRTRAKAWSRACPVDGQVDLDGARDAMRSPFVVASRVRSRTAGDPRSLTGPLDSTLNRVSSKPPVPLL